MKIIILISLMSIAFGCRSKHKVTSDYKEKEKVTENIKMDSLNLKSSKSVKNETTDATFLEKKNEISGDLLIKGKSDESNPFIFHHVLGKDTLQSISIMGNAEYVINNHYAKFDNKKIEVTKKESEDIFQDLSQKAVSKKAVTETTSEVKQQTKEIKAKGLQAGTWIAITISVIVLILAFFTYKYLKK